MRTPTMMLSAIAAVAVLAPTPAPAATYIDDPLTSPTFAGRGSKGGSFGADGWTTTNAPTDMSQDSVWYEIADALPTGSVSYTVSGLSVGGSLSGYDHDILTIYQAPTGSVEPIAYMPGFRNNDFKAFTRIFGSMEAGRSGAMKLELAFCPRGEPWYHDTACPAGCDQSGIAYANGTQNDVGWDPAVAYRMSVAWSPGQVSFSRDGVTLGTITFSGTYAAQPLRVRIGSPRDDGIYPGQAFMPPGLKFRDVLIEGTPGTQTEVCTGGTGGTGGAGTTTTTTTTPTGGDGIEYAALQDVTGASWEPGVYPDVNDLNVEAAADGTPTAVVYLRFPPFPGVAKKAILRLHAEASPSAAGGSGIPCAVSDDTWQETTLTWATRPALGNACVGAPISVDPGADLEWDVTALVGSGAGNHGFAIVSHDPDGAHYVSKEAGGSVTGPRLYIEADTSPQPDAGTGGTGGIPTGSGGTGGIPTGSGGTATGFGGTGGTGAKGGTGGVGASGASSGGEGSGCGCRVEGSGPGASWAVGIAIAALAARRRRRG